MSIAFEIANNKLPVFGSKTSGCCYLTEKKNFLQLYHENQFLECES